MPRVEMLTSVATAAWCYEAGLEYDVSSDVARELVTNSAAVLVRDEPIETPEHRTAMETRRGPGRPPKNPR